MTAIDSESSAILETITNFARSNSEWDKVYQHILFHPNDFFVILPGRRWAIAHQVVYHGHIDLFKRILALFSIDQINIHSKTNDNKTFLDIATEERTTHPEMYSYIEHLFAQDELIRQAKQSNWRLVMDILHRNKQLANEKPPYSPGFLLHYVVEKGDRRVLQELLDHFQPQTNVTNYNTETPADLARRLKKYDLCSILQSKVLTSSFASQNQRPLSNQPDKQSTYHSLVNSSNKSTLPSSGTRFEKTTIDITQDDHNTTKLQDLSHPVRNRLPKQLHTEVQHLDTHKSVIKGYPLVNSESPRSPSVSISSNQMSLKDLICPITDELLIDPVIASDGYTYERHAILDWVNQFHMSPKTGKPMNATFRDDIGKKQIIASRRAANEKMKDIQ